jgi:hypothetical protein
MRPGIPWWMSTRSRAICLGNILKGQIVQHVYSFRDGLIERMDIRNPGIGYSIGGPRGP